LGNNALCESVTPIKKLHVIIIITILWLLALARFASGMIWTDQIHSFLVEITEIPYVVALNVPPRTSLLALNGPVDARKAQMRSIITSAAIKHGLDPNLLIAIAVCESGLRPDAQNRWSSASGLFQFVDSTWKTYAKKYGIAGPKNDPYVQSELAALMIANGGIGHWNASSYCWK